MNLRSQLTCEVQMFLHFHWGEWKAVSDEMMCLRSHTKCGRSGLKISHLLVHTSSPSLYTLWALKSEMHFIHHLCDLPKKTQNFKKVNSMLFISTQFCKKVGII